MLEDELRRLLHELIDATGADAAAIELRNGDAAAAASGTDPTPPADSGAAPTPLASAAGVTSISADGATAEHVVPLGGGAVLRVSRGADTPGPDLAAAAERSARAIRAAARRWDVAHLPAVSWSRDQRTNRDRIRARIESFLVAFANAPGIANAAVTRGSEVVASAAPLAEVHTMALPLLLKRIAVEARRHRGETAHVEIVSDDIAAFAFWIDACLVAFFDGPHAADFVRHRARLISREISVLLPELDEPPDAPAAVAPRPE